MFETVKEVYFSTNKSTEAYNQILWRMPEPVQNRRDEKSFKNYKAVYGEVSGELCVKEHIETKMTVWAAGCDNTD